jgi:hypothetical protein
MTAVSDMFLFIRITLFAAAVPLLTRIPLRRLELLLEPDNPGLMLSTEKIERILRHTDYICRVGRRLISSLCLTRGITLFYFMRRAGMDVALVFGAGEMNGAFAGHCWLARNGEPFLEKTDPRAFFTPMYSFNRSVTSTVKEANREAVDERLSAIRM